jgi:hypothetical protein
VGNSWRLESALDAYLEKKDRMPSDGPPAVPSFRCPFCGAVEMSVPELDRHLSTIHVVARPFLMLRGREIARHSVLRTPVTSSDVSVSSASFIELRVNNRTPVRLEPVALGTHLSVLRQENVSISIFNCNTDRLAPTPEEYHISFRITSAETLRRVERAFFDIITSGDLTLATIRSFLSDTRSLGEGADYADALGTFSVGILRKDDFLASRLSTSPALYRDDYVQAEQALRSIPRPLARVVAQLIRFALNDFSESALQTGCWELDAAYQLLHTNGSPVYDRLKRQPAKRFPICPIDNGTKFVIDLVARMSKVRRWNKSINEELMLISRSVDLDSMDRQKILALWALSALRLGAKHDAIEPLRAITAVYPFSNWATHHLEEVTA